jgi:xylulokinase
MAVTGEAPDAVCTPPAREETIFPDPVLADAYAAQIAKYRALNTRIADVVREA